MPGCNLALINAKGFLVFLGVGGAAAATARLPFVFLAAGRALLFLPTRRAALPLVDCSRCPTSKKPEQQVQSRRVAASRSKLKKPSETSLQSLDSGSTLIIVSLGDLAPMLIGYVRVSKSDGSQTLELQRDALLAAGVEPDRIYQDLVSGRYDAHPGLIACLKVLQPGNTLVIWRLDRIGRDLRHLVDTVEALRVRGVGLKVLAGAGAQIDTTTANGRLAFDTFAAFAEFERGLTAERTQAGLVAARARGRMGGRPRKMDRAMLAMAMAAMSDPKAKAAEVARRLGLTTTTLYAYVNGDGSPKAAGTAVLDGTPSRGSPAVARG